MPLLQVRDSYFDTVRDDTPRNHTIQLLFIHSLCTVSFCENAAFLSKGCAVLHDT